LGSFSVALRVALLDGAALGVLDLLRVFRKFGWPADPADLLPLLGYVTGLSVLGAFLLLLPCAVLVHFGPRALRRLDPWTLFHAAWIGTNVLLLFVWKRYAAVVEAGGSYTFPPLDFLVGLLLALLAGILLGPVLARTWRLAGSALRWPFRRARLGRMGVGATAAILTAALTALPAPGGTGAAPGKTRPDARNVLLVLVDAARPDHVGLYGYGPDTTPNLDALARRSVIATRYLSNSSYTLPALASIWTSRNPAAHGVTNYGSVLREEFTTLAEAFRAEGYETAAFSATQLITPEFGFAQGFDTYRIFRDYRGDFFYARVLDEMGLVRRDKRVSAQYLNARVLRWLAEPRERPFFLVVFYADPHFEYSAPRDLIERFADPDYLRVAEVHEFLAAYARGKRRDEESLAFVRSLYDAELAYVDRAVGELWKKLEELGEAGQTVMAVTSDHGEQFYEHGTSRHGKSLYMEEVHCPLVIVDPERKGQARVEAPTRGIDIYPTLLEAAGITPPEGLEGASILPLAGRGPRAAVRESLMIVSKDNYLQAYWVDPWMLIFNRGRIRSPADRGLELYNLERDPGQRENLADARPDVREKMVAALDARIRDSRAAGPAPEKPIDQERMELLRELHYVK
jgi:arylsulfatase A-like enzyme